MYGDGKGIGGAENDGFGSYITELTVEGGSGLLLAGVGAFKSEDP